METVISYVEIHVAILCTLATIEYLRVTYFVNEKFNNCDIVGCVLLTDHNKSLLHFSCLPRSKYSISAFEIFRNRTATVRRAACDISARKAAAPRRRRWSGAAAAFPTPRTPPPLAANAACSLAQSSNFHWLGKIYRSDRPSLQDFLS